MGERELTCRDLFRVFVIGLKGAFVYGRLHDIGDTILWCGHDLPSIAKMGKRGSILAYLSKIHTIMTGLDRAFLITFFPITGIGHRIVNARFYGVENRPL